MFIVQFAVLGGGPVLKANNFFLGVFVFGGLLIAINQYTELIPELMFARAALIIEDEGQCLRIKRVPQGSTQIYSPFRGRSRYFGFFVTTRDGDVRGELYVDGYASEHVQKTRTQNMENTHKYCQWEDIGHGLLKSTLMLKDLGVDEFSRCDTLDRSGISSWRSTIYIGSIDDDSYMHIRCGNGPIVYCGGRLGYKSWIFEVLIPKEKLKHWKAVTLGAKKLFDEILQPLPACPIQISIPIPII